MGGLDASDGILDDDTGLGRQAEVFGGLEEDLWFRLALADVVAIGDLVEIVTQADSFKDERGVLARRADRQFQSHRPQMIEGRAHRLIEVCRRHLLQHLAVELVLLARQFELACLAQWGAGEALENDLEALHPADATQSVINRLVKWDAQLVGQGFPGQVVVVVGVADHPIEIKNHGLDAHRRASHRPQKASTGLWPLNSERPTSLSTSAVSTLSLEL